MNLNFLMISIHECLDTMKSKNFSSYKNCVLKVSKHLNLKHANAVL